MTETNPQWWDRTTAEPVAGPAPQQAAPPRQGGPQAPVGQNSTPPPGPSGYSYYAAPAFPGAQQVQQGPHAAGRQAQIVTGVCGVVALLSFFALPAVSLPFVGSVSMASLFSFFGQFQSGVGVLMWLIVIPMVAIAGLGLGAGLTASSTLSGRFAAAVVSEICACIVALLYLLPLLSAFKQRSALESAVTAVGIRMLGFGFYLTLLSLIVAIVVGAIVLRDISRAQRSRR